MEKKILYIGHSWKRPWGNLRYQHGTAEEPNMFNLKSVNETILQDVRRGEIYEYEVRIEAGTYYNFRYDWTHMHDAAVTFVPYGGEVILNGGRRITGFVPVTVNGVAALKAEIPAVKNGEWYFSQLYVNKTPRRRPVYPKNGEKLRVASVPGHTADDSQGVDFFCADPGIFDRFTNISDTSVEVLHYWLSELFPVVSYDPETACVRLGAHARMSLNNDRDTGFAKYRINNVFEMLNEPGEWYLDRKEGILYYIPLPGETAENILVEAPVQQNLLTIRGTDDSPVSNITFRNIVFENTKYDPCNGAGNIRYASYGQAAGNCDAAVSVSYAHHIHFEGCTIRNIGNYGIEFRKGTSYNTVTDCEITGCGAGGIRFDGGAIGAPESDKCQNNRIENNHVHHCTKIDYAAIGIFLGHASSNRIAHNEIHDLKYSGISVGWVWGMLPSRSDNNIIEYNHVYRCGDGDLSDMGGIYLLGPQSGTEVRGNYIHDIHRANYGGWGIYLDEGSTNIVVEKNIVYDCDSNAFFIHYGRENIIRYNIFGNGDAVIGFGAGIESNYGNFMKNLLYTENDTVYFGDYNYDFQNKWLVTDANFIYATGTAPLKNLRYGPRYESFDDWNRLGNDVFSRTYRNADARPTRTPAELLPFGFPADVDIALAGIKKK